MTTIEEGLAFLTRAIESAPPEVESLVSEARAVQAVVRERVEVGGDRTVVAIAGATGSGKSSLVNALAGAEVSRTAATRPTTTQAVAVSTTDAPDLLDWLGVEQRHVLADAPLSEAAVIVDLPDVDSVERRHVEIASKIIGRADAAVFVLDPQKYADAIVHDRFLKKLTEHADTTLVVLNQIDRVPPAERDALIRDVRRLVDRDGLAAHVLVTSVRTGEGIEQLRESLATMVKRHRAMRDQLAARIRSVGNDIEAGIEQRGGSAPSTRAVDFEPAAEAIAYAAGVDTVASAARESYLARSGRRAAGVLRRFRPLNDPVSALGLDSGAYVPQASRAVSARRAVSEYSREVLADAPTAWRDAETARAVSATDDVVADASSMLRTFNVRGNPPMWWSITGALFTILCMAAIAGAAWLVALTGLVGLRLPEPPYVGPVSVPLALVVGGVGIGLVLGRLVAWWRAVGARRQYARVIEAFSDACEERARTRVVDPLRVARERYAGFYWDINALKGVR